MSTTDGTPDTEEALDRRLQQLGLSGREDDWTDRYLLCEHLVEPAQARARQRFEAVARFMRDLIAHRWVKTRETRERLDPKRIYYLSMEFLIGRALNNNLINMAADPLIDRAIRREGWDLSEILEQEPDAGLGNGGLGRLAACFIESLATLQYSAMGYGLRYEYGIFRQSIRDGYQVEEPDNWLRRPDPWEVVRPGKMYPVPLQASFELTGAAITDHPEPAVDAARRRLRSAGGRLRRTLRQHAATLAAAAPEHFDFAEFSQGDFVGAVIGNVAAESLTRVLYPDDSTDAGRTLRFLQQYFMVSCSLQDILARFREGRPRRWTELPDHVAIQLNDTHPALAVAELMRISARPGAPRLGRSLGPDGPHARLHEPHAAAGGAREVAGRALRAASFPRHLEIIYEINRRFLDDVRARFPDDDRRRQPHEPDRGGTDPHGADGASRGRRHAQHERRRRDPLGPAAHARAARLRRDVSRAVQQQDQRRHAATLAADGQSDAVAADHGGDRRRLDDRLDRSCGRLRPRRRRGVPRAVSRAKAAGEGRFVDWLAADQPGARVDPDTIFDSQIKRIHEYKRQLLNVLHVVVPLQPAASASRIGRSRRARSSSPARRRPRIVSPSSSSS